MEDIISSYAVFDTVTLIAVCAFAAVMLVLAILAVIALFSQKNLLTQIHNTLLRQGTAQSAPIYAQPAADTCKKCGAAYKPGSVFCQRCGSAL